MNSHPFDHPKYKGSWTLWVLSLVLQPYPQKVVRLFDRPGTHPNHLLTQDYRSCDLLGHTLLSLKTTAGDLPLEMHTCLETRSSHLARIQIRSGFGQSKWPASLQLSVGLGLGWR